MDRPIALELDRVSLDFPTPDGGVYRAIDEVSLSISAGAFVAIVGPSGCGKSTLLNLVAGLLTPTSGHVRVEGQSLCGLNRHATYMFQQDTLFPWKDVRDNVALGLMLAGVSKADAHARADGWIARVGLTPFASHYPSQLSGGMRKRVTMAQNWILDRPQVLMDEPFSALDVHTRQLMESELLSLWDVGAAGAPRRTVVFVTHDLDEAIALADEVVVLSAGPASRIVGRHAVSLARPRDLRELRTSDAFVELYRAIWSVLRREVIKSQASEGARV
ncbi:MAG: ABC transporter ATP-binding protein [Acidobacteria bacterium]|nr:ABC transporter ATP-binding protein [Acidobacteriota bacterium]